MEGLKAIVDGIERLLYEALGLVVPGAALVLAVAYILAGPEWSDLLTFIDGHTWLAIGAAYVLGYAIQGISRPVTTALGWLLFLPIWLMLAVAGLPRWRQLRQWANMCLSILRQRLVGRDAPKQAADDTFDLTDLTEAYWTLRLTIPTGKRLSTSQVRDLSFSMLLTERKYLDRFRAASALTRGVAVAAVAAFSLLLYQITMGVRPLSTLLAAALVGLLVVFYGLIERAGMYDALWREIVPAQFLCTITHAKTIVHSSASTVNGADASI